MAFIDWSDQFGTGIEMFDDHHRQLVNLINRLYEAIQAGTAANQFEQILNELSDYVLYHFNTEEHWMKSISYSDLAAHEQEHYRFVKRLFEIQRNYHEKKVVKPLEVVSFLKNWLANHIQVVDKQYVVAHAGRLPA